MSTALRNLAPLVLLVWLGGCHGPGGEAAPPEGPVSLVGLAGERIRPLATPGPGADVFLFLRTDCPISNRYAPEIRRLHERFGPRGVAFWIVYPDPDEPLPAIRKHLEEYGYPGTPARDPEHSLVARTAAQVTPEAAVFAAGELRYVGRIDDRFVDFGKTRAAATRHDLADALEAVLDGRPVPEPRTRAVGCFIPDLD